MFYRLKGACAVKDADGTDGQLDFKTPTQSSCLTACSIAEQGQSGQPAYVEDAGKFVVRAVLSHGPPAGQCYGYGASSRGDSCGRGTGSRAQPPKAAQGRAACRVPAAPLPGPHTNSPDSHPSPATHHPVTRHPRHLHRGGQDALQLPQPVPHLGRARQLSGRGLRAGRCAARVTARERRPAPPRPCPGGGGTPPSPPGALYDTLAPEMNKACVHMLPCSQHRTARMRAHARAHARSPGGRRGLAARGAAARRREKPARRSFGRRDRGPPAPAPAARPPPAIDLTPPRPRARGGRGGGRPGPAPAAAATAGCAPRHIA
jgi:hypothetical protein